MQQKINKQLDTLLEKKCYAKNGIKSFVISQKLNNLLPFKSSLQSAVT